MATATSGSLWFWRQQGPCCVRQITVMKFKTQRGAKRQRHLFCQSLKILCSFLTKEPLNICCKGKTPMSQPEFLFSNKSYWLLWPELQQEVRPTLILPSQIFCLQSLWEREENQLVDENRTGRFRATPACLKHRCNHHTSFAPYSTPSLWELGLDLYDMAIMAYVPSHWFKWYAT